MTDEEWDDLWTKGPTQWEVDQSIRRQALAHERDEQAAMIADWRSRHPEATCRDAVALELAKMEAAFGKIAPW